MRVRMSQTFVTISKPFDEDFMGVTPRAPTGCSSIPKMTNLCTSYLDERLMYFPPASMSPFVYLMISLLSFPGLAHCGGEIRVPEELYNLIGENFKDVGGAHLYFCDLRDGVGGLKWLTKRTGQTYGVHWLQRLDDPSGQLEMSDSQPQRLGVFVDLSCPQGMALLSETQELYNASYSWLLWTPDNELPGSLEATLAGSRLSLDSEVKLVQGQELEVFDVWRVHFSKSLVLDRLYSSNETNPQWPSYPRPRTDLQGFVFNASLMMIDIEFNESNLIAPLLDKSYESGKDMVRRYGLSIFIHLAEMYNFRYRYLLSHSWGEPLPNGSMTGMVGQVMRGEAEFGLAPAKYVIDRYLIIDYITSLHIVKVCFTFIQPRRFGSKEALVLPFSPATWAGLASLCLLSLLALRLLARVEGAATAEGWSGTAVLVIGALAQQGISDTTERGSTRIVYIFLLVVCFFAGVFYNTSILNGLLLQAPNAIQDLGQLLGSDIKLGFLDIPYIRHEMDTLSMRPSREIWRLLPEGAWAPRRTTVAQCMGAGRNKGFLAHYHSALRLITENDSLTERVREKTSKSEVVYFTVPEGVKLMRTGKFALYTEDEAVYAEILRQMTDAEVCGVTEVIKYNPFHVGAIARKNSPYKELFNRGFSLMRERGVLRRQLEHWILKRPDCQWRQDAITLGTEPLALAYLAFICGVCTSLLCLIGEIIIQKNFSRAPRYPEG